MNADLVIVYGGTVITGGRVLTDTSVVMEGGKIVDLVPDRSVATARDGTVVSAEGRIVCPGLINLHLHGGGGWDAMEGTYEALCGMAMTHAEFGTTVIAPTIAGFSENSRKGFFAAILRCLDEGTGSAEVIGVNWETPFINPRMAGAFDRTFLAEPTPEAVASLLAEARGTLKIATVAPELPGALAAIRHLTGSGVLVSIGHTDASYEEAKAGIDAGATLGTHIFNTSRGISHRDIGAAGALLLDERVTVELIADGHHVSPSAAKLVFKLKGRDGLYLITDSIEAAGTNMPSFTLRNGLHVEIREGRTWGPEDRLIGSILTMDQAVRNLMEWFGLELTEAIRYATAVPARVMGIADRKGSIEIGKDADIIIADQNFSVQATFVGGRRVYPRS